MPGVISEIYLCGTTLFIQVKAAGDEIAWYMVPWSTAQNEGIPGVLAAIEAAGPAYAQPLPQWCEQLLEETVTFP